MKQVTASSTSYVEANFADADPSHTCIKGVRATVGIHKAASQTDTGTTNIISGAATTAVYSGDHLGVALPTGQPGR